MERPDQLRELFRMQHSLNQRIGVETDGLNDEEKTRWVLTLNGTTEEIRQVSRDVHRFRVKDEHPPAA